MSTEHCSGLRNADRHSMSWAGCSDGSAPVATRCRRWPTRRSRVLPGDPETSVSVPFQGFPTTVVTTDSLALDCDESQYAHGDGPCMHAARSGQLTEIADAHTDTRQWSFVQEAAERGALSSLSVPLPIRQEGVCAALTVYARNAFDEESRSVATRFAPLAARAVTTMQAFEDAKKMAETWPG